MACGECSASLASVVELEDCMREVMQRGLLSATVTADLIEKGSWEQLADRD